MSELLETRRLQGFGLELAADVSEGEPRVLLLHGGGQTRFSWREFATLLHRLGFGVTSLDLRGHGDSDWSEDGNYGLEAHARDVAAVVGRLPSAPVLVGASLGGLAALLAVGELGTPAAALVLVDVAPHVARAGTERIVAFMRAHPEGFATLEEAGRAVASYLPHRPPPTDLSGLERNLRRRDDGRYVWAWDPRILESTGKGVLAQRDRLDKAAAKVSVPFLLIRGAESDVVTEDAVAELNALVPHLTVMDVPRAGHMVAGDRNAQFGRAVLAFLNAIASD